MDLFIGLILFTIAMASSIILNYSMILALLIGLIIFTFLGLRRGFSIGDIAKSSLKGMEDSMIVIYVMAVIGFITASWRMSGTITIFVYYGMKIITPSFFLIIAFLLSCILSYALGTSFGVAGTVGIIFMTLARSGGIDPVITAGVLMSGIYFGDRASPVSSSANLVAGITGTKIYDNVKMMMKTAMLPLLITLVLYTILSFKHPISHVDEGLVAEFEEAFILSPLAIIPAIIMLVLPLFKLNILISMGLSILSASLIAWQVQGVPIIKILETCIMGYEVKGDGLSKILNGGGLVSMLEIVGILIISGCYSGIFSKTELLNSIQGELTKMTNKWGRFQTMLMMSIVSSMIFCNQTIAGIMCNDLMAPAYLNDKICSDNCSDKSLDNSMYKCKEELAIDMENSVILIGCIVPWCIGCTVPLSFFKVDFHGMIWAFYMYLVPICYLFTKKIWYKNK